MSSLWKNKGGLLINCSCLFSCAANLRIHSDISNPSTMLLVAETQTEHPTASGGRGPVDRLSLSEHPDHGQDLAPRFFPPAAAARKGRSRPEEAAECQLGGLAVDRGQRRRGAHRPRHARDPGDSPEVCWPHLRPTRSTQS